MREASEDVQAEEFNSNTLSWLNTTSTSFSEESPITKLFICFGHESVVLVGSLHCLDSLDRVMGPRIILNHPYEHPVSRLCSGERLGHLLGSAEPDLSELPAFLILSISSIYIHTAVLKVQS